MHIRDALLLMQTTFITLALILIGWQVYKLRVATESANCQAIVENFFRIVENPDFASIFSFGPEWEQLSAEEQRRVALCSTVFAFLEQLYVEASAGQLTPRLTGPWVEFVRYWLKQDKIKAYWHSSTTVCPRNGFDAGFQKFVQDTYKT